jgi:hypothetical protein
MWRTKKPSSCSVDECGGYGSVANQETQQLYEYNQRMQRGECGGPRTRQRQLYDQRIKECGGYGNEANQETRQLYSQRMHKNFVKMQSLDV